MAVEESTREQLCCLGSGGVLATGDRPRHLQGLSEDPAPGHSLM